MRKLIIALVATSAIAGQAAADFKGGFYLGANASANALLGKGNWSYNDSRTTVGALNPDPAGPISYKDHADLGRWGAGVGIYAGYGILSGCMYYAGELAYDWIEPKAKHSFNYSPVAVLYDPTEVTSTKARISIKKENIFNFAAIIGRKVTADTIFYIRLGGNVSETEMNANVFGKKLHKSKTNLSFVPGAGIETSIINTKLVARLEWTYDLGNKISKTSKVNQPAITDTGPNIIVSAGTETFKASTKNVGLHSVKLGIAYKF